MKKEGDFITFEYLSQIDENKIPYEKKDIVIKVNEDDYNDLEKFVKMGEYYGKLINSL